MELSPFEGRLARLVVDTLALELAPGEIKPEQPLFVTGLGLDSIDALEISLAISKKYGVKLSTENTDIAAIFSSIRSLASYIEKNMVK